MDLIPWWIKIPHAGPKGWKQTKSTIVKQTTYIYICTHIKLVATAEFWRVLGRESNVLVFEIRTVSQMVECRLVQDGNDAGGRERGQEKPHLLVRRWQVQSEHHPKVKVKVIQSCPTLQPHERYSPWNSPGQSTGVGSLSLLQWILLTQEWNQDLVHYRWILYQLSYQGHKSHLHIVNHWVTILRANCVRQLITAQNSEQEKF